MLFEYSVEDVKAIQWVLKTDDPWYGQVNDFSITVPFIHNSYPNLITRTYDFDNLSPIIKRPENTLGSLNYDKIRTKIRLVQAYIKKMKSERLKPYLNFRTNFRCCYCARDHIDEASLDLDIEHILPKKVFSDCYYDLDNLSISCKRCNMEIKGDDYSFLKGELYDLAKLLNPSARVYIKRKDVNHKYIFKKQYFESLNYFFIHPNLDIYYNHIDCIRLDFKNRRYTIYDPLTEKGKYTYDYFKLKEFEVNEFKDIQRTKKKQVKDELLRIFEKVLGVD